MNNNKNSNSNINELETSTRANSHSFSELGEVKVALGRLYKEFDNFKLSQKSEREKDRAELQAWAQTNLIQNQLLNKTMATIELLTNELRNQGLSWSEFEKNNTDLKQELILLLEQSRSMPKSSTMLESLEFKGLKSSVSELKQEWNNLVTHTNKLTTTIQELKKSPPKTIQIQKEVYRAEPQGKYWFVASVTALLTLIFFFIINQFIGVKISNDITSYLHETWERAGFSNTKLQRVEQQLGTEPKRKK
jgi:hypothetical protein